MSLMARDRLRQWWPLLLVVAAASSTRAYAFGVPASPGESLHYVVAREFGHSDPLISGLIWWFNFLLHPFVWARPAFYAALWAPAQISLDATRLVSLAVTFLLPILLYAVLDRLGVARGIALSAALVPALHPAFVFASVRISPVSWMCVAVLASLWAQLAQRPRTSALLLALAIGCDRLAIPAGAGLLPLALSQGRSQPGFRLWPLRVNEQVSGYLLVMAIAPLPLVYSALSTWGLYGGPSVRGLLLQCFLGGWLVVGVLAGLVLRPARAWSMFGLVYPALFLLSLRFLGRSATTEQTLVAALASLVATSLTLEGSRVWIRRASRHALPALAAAAIFGLVVAPAFGALSPTLDPLAQRSLGQEVALARHGVTWFTAARWLEGAPQVMLVDVPLEALYHPFHDAAPNAPLQYVYSSAPENLTLWSRAIEANGTRTLVVQTDQPLNVALRETYADCITHQEGGFVLIEGAACGGRSQRLYETSLARHDPPQGAS